MKCPKCGKEMEKIRKDFSYGSKNKEYLRVIYVCKKDDIWVTVETPEKNP